ncbi:MAG: hypothetical protein RLZ81_24 [Pseudomonadota bacterium]|jgi:DNA-binding SARP family transcriptional activator
MPTPLNTGRILSDHDEGPLALALLGEPCVVREGAPPHLLERHDAALLALLVLAGPQSRSELAQLLWPDASTSAGLNGLRQRLSRLRRTVGHSVVDGKGSLHLAKGIKHDLHPGAFEHAASDFELLGALSYPEGDLLADRVQALRERWRHLRSEALEREASRLEAEKNFDGALRLAERLLIAHPISEHAHRRSMRLHYLRGDRGQALAAYERCRHRLHVAVGVTPDEETQGLADLIRSGGLPRQSAAGTTAKVALARPPQLVGRGNDWNALQGAWDRGEVIVLRGEAGIGKTRLAEEFARAQGPALVVKAHAGEQAMPYALLTRCLRAARERLPPPPDWAAAELARLAPEWGASAPGTLQPLRLRQALTASLSPWADSGMGALLIDDLQWGDAASVEALLMWLSETGSRRPPTVLVVRSAEMPENLLAWLKVQPPATVLDWPLGPLDVCGVEAFIASLMLPSLPATSRPAAATALLHRTGGHPFVLLELLRADPDAWADDFLASNGGASYQHLLSMIARRLNQLPAPTLRLAQLAALAGGAFSLKLAATVLGVHALGLADAWRGLTDAGLMQADGMVYDLVSEAALRTIPHAVAHALHEQIAVGLENQGHRPEVIATHWKACERWADAARCFALAAETAKSAGRRAEELALWDHATDCFDLNGNDVQSWQAKHSAVAAAQVTEGSQGVLGRIDALAAAATQDGQRLDVLLARSRAQINTSESQAAVAPSQEAIELARRLGDRCREIAAVGWHGLALAMTDHAEEGLSLLESYADAARQATDARLRLDFFGSLGYALHVAGRYRHALAAVGMAADLAEELCDFGEAVEQVANLSTCHKSLGDHESALRQGERAVGFWRRLGEPKSVSAAAIQVQLAAVYYVDGRYAQALALLNWSRDCFRETGPASWQTIAEHRLAVVYLRLGRPDLARQAMSALPAASADAGLQATRMMIECRLAHQSGRPVADTLQKAADQLAAMLTPMDRRALLLLLAAHQSAEDSLALSQELLGEALAAEDLPAALHAQARIADAYRRLGDPHEAARYARLAWDSAGQTPPLDIDYPTWCWLVFQAARNGGDTETADEALQKGVAWIKRALPHVPEHFVSSFRNTNPTNRDLLTAASAA